MRVEAVVGRRVLRCIAHTRGGDDPRVSIIVEWVTVPRSGIRGRDSRGGAADADQLFLQTLCIGGEARAR